MPTQESELDFSNVYLVWRGALGGALGAPAFLVGLAVDEKLRTGQSLMEARFTYRGATVSADRIFNRSRDRRDNLLCRNKAR